MTDYAKELENYSDAPADERKDLEKLAALQKDIAISGSAEDFIRHPFFKAFENHLNDMINDSKGAILTIESLADLQSFKERIKAIQEVKRWITSKVMAGRVAKQAIEIYEQETDDLNQKIQEAVEQSQLPPQS